MDDTAILAELREIRKTLAVIAAKLGGEASRGPLEMPRFPCGHQHVNREAWDRCREAIDAAEQSVPAPQYTIVTMWDCGHHHATRDQAIHCRAANGLPAHHAV